jgi:hypothetical protein
VNKLCQENKGAKYLQCEIQSGSGKGFWRTAFKPDSGFEWHSCFKAGGVSAENYEHSRRPSTSKMTENVEIIQELIHEDRHQTVHELADTIWISYRVCQEILTENLNMRHIAPS